MAEEGRGREERGKEGTGKEGREKGRERKGGRGGERESSPPNANSWIRPWGSGGEGEGDDLMNTLLMYVLPLLVICPIYQTAHYLI